MTSTRPTKLPVDFPLCPTAELDALAAAVPQNHPLQQFLLALRNAILYLDNPSPNRAKKLYRATIQ